MSYSFPIDPENSSRAQRRAKAKGLEVKGLGARIGDVRFDPNAEDGDGDGLVQDNTMYERPSVPSLPQAPTGGLTRTAQGKLKPQSELTSEEMLDIDREREKRRTLAGLRSSVAKPTGGTEKPIPYFTTTNIDGDIVSVRELFPSDSSTPAPHSLDWLKNMSDDEIAEAVVPRSVEDLAAMCAQMELKEELGGVDVASVSLLGDTVQKLYDLIDELQKTPGNEELIERIRSFAERDRSRVGTFSLDELRDEIDNIPAAPRSRLDFISRRASMFLGAVSLQERAIATKLQAHYQGYVDAINAARVEFGFDFSADARDKAMEVVKRALAESESFAWAVRTFGMPPIRVVTQAAHDAAKYHSSGQDKRAEPLLIHAGAWFQPLGGEKMLGITLNMSDRAFAADRPRDAVSGASVPVKYRGFPTDAIVDNVSFSQPDVLMHEWGHFFYHLFTRRGTQKNLERLGFDPNRIRALSKRMRGMYDSEKGDLFRGTSILRLGPRVSLQTLGAVLLYDPTQPSLLGKSPRELAKDLVGQINRNIGTIRQITDQFGRPALPPNFPGFTVDAMGQIVEQRQLMSLLAMGDYSLGGRTSVNTTPLHMVVVDSPYFNPWLGAHEIEQNTGVRAPLTFSTYALTNPQENWAEGVLAFFSPNPAARALNTQEKRMDIAEYLGLDSNNGKHDKPWLNRSSGLRSSTTGVDTERDNLPIPDQSQRYPREVGGMRSRVDLDKRAEVLGVDISSFKDTSNDDDDVMWSTNEFSISRTDRVEAGDAVIVRDGENGAEVLMITRKNGPFRNALALPGGIRESEEPLDRVAAREAMEEVGVRASDAVNTQLLGEIDTRDWDPRFVEGGRVAGVRMDVDESFVPNAADDAEGYQWVSLSQIASGRVPIAFGHATWIAEAFRGDADLYEKLTVLAEASRVRNRRIIAKVDRERAKKGLKQFGKLPDPNAPYATVFPERRLGLRSTTQSGVPYSRIISNDEMLASKISELRAQQAGSRDRIEKLQKAKEEFKKTGAWKGAELGVSLTPGKSPVDISKEEVNTRGWKDEISQMVDQSISQTEELQALITGGLRRFEEVLERRKSSPVNAEEYDDIRTDPSTYQRLASISNYVAFMPDEQKRDVFNRDGFGYFVSMSERDQDKPFTQRVDLVRAEVLPEAWTGLYEQRNDGEVVSSLSFTPDGEVSSPVDSPVGEILEGWAKVGVDRDAGMRSASSRSPFLSAKDEYVNSLDADINERQDYVSRLKDALAELDETGVWKGADYQVSVNPQAEPTNMTRDELVQRNFPPERLASAARGRIDVLEQELGEMRESRERIRRQPATTTPIEAIVASPELTQRLKERGEEVFALPLEERREIFSDGDYDYVVHWGADVLEGGVIDPSRSRGDADSRAVSGNTRRVNKIGAGRLVTRRDEQKKLVQDLKEALQKFNETGVVDFSIQESALRTTLFPILKEIEAGELTPESRDQITSLLNSRIGAEEESLAKIDKIADQLLADDYQHASAYDASRMKTATGYGGRYAEGDEDSWGDDRPMGARTGIHVFRVRKGEDATDQMGIAGETYLIGKHTPIASLSTETHRNEGPQPTSGLEVWRGWLTEVVEADKRSRSGQGAGMRSSTTRRAPIAGRDIEQVLDELELTEEEKNVAREALKDTAEAFSTGEIFEKPIHDAIDADRERLLNSIRIEIGDDGIPMIIADPNPLFFQFIPDKRDWSKVRLPSSETVKKVKDILLGNQNRDRQDDFGNNWYSLYRNVLDRVKSIPGSREYTPKNTGNFLELHIAGLNNPSETLVGEAEDIVIHDSFGHVGIGRGFDRHGEWANWLSTVSMVKAATEEEMSNEDKEGALRHSLVYYGLTQLARLDNVDWWEWKNLVDGYDGNILDIIELLDESDRTQVLNNDGSRPAGMRSRTRGTTPIGNATPEVLNQIADTDALRAKRNEVLRGEVIDSASVPSRANREKIEATPEIEEYARFMRATEKPQERIKRLIEALEGVAVKDYDKTDINDIIAEMDKQLKDMIDEGLFRRFPNESRPEEADDSWYAMEALEKASEIMSRSVYRDVTDDAKADELVERVQQWEVGFVDNIYDMNEKSLEQSLIMGPESALKSLNYTKPELRERLKRQIMAGDKGGKPGQWSARKAQLLAQAYRKAGGGYRGGLRKTQRSIKRWTREDWTTSDGKPANRPGGMRRYLPRKAWSRLTPAERRATNRKKIQGSRRGNQFVANTQRARTVGRNVRRKK